MGEKDAIRSFCVSMIARTWISLIRLLLILQKVLLDKQDNYYPRLKREVIGVHMKTGVEQAVYAILLLNMLPDKAVLPGEAISQQLGTSPTYFQKLLRKLVSAGLITSVPGVKGGFKLVKKPEDICVFDVYSAIEGKQSLYLPSGVLGDLLALEEQERCCLLTDLMGEAETAWRNVMQRETIASLSIKMNEERFQAKTAALQEWLKEKMVS